AAGTPNKTDRNWNTYKTILSGDLDNNDSEDGTINGSNAYHVVINAGQAGDPALLDGFIIKGGAASGSGTITVNGQSIKASHGGGIYYSSSNALLVNTIICQNTAAGKGGGIYIQEFAQPNFRNVLVSGNKADKGGGIYNDENCFITALNISVSGNAASAGGAIYNDLNSILVMDNSIIWGNSSGAEDKFFSLVNTSIIQGGFAASLDEDPLFVNAPSYETAPFSKGDYRLKRGSPAIDAGNQAVYPNPETDKDAGGTERLYGTAIDIGAYEWQKGEYAITFSGLEEGKITAVYGAADFSPASANPEADITYSLPTDNGVAEIADGKVKILAAGEVELTASIAENDDYKALSVSRILKITKAPLTVTAKDSTKVYDGTAFGGGNDVVYSGFVNSEDESVLSGTLTYAGTSQGAKDADIYAITP